MKEKAPFNVITKTIRLSGNNDSAIICIVSTETHTVDIVKLTNTESRRVEKTLCTMTISEAKELLEFLKLALWKMQ